MADLTRAFIIWLICFGAVALGMLTALHLVLRRMRSAKKAAETNRDAESPNAPAAGFSLTSRLLIVLVIGGVYLGVLGPLAGKVLRYLKITASTTGSAYFQNEGQNHNLQLTTATELDSSGRPVLIPVPDPISAD